MTHDRRSPGEAAVLDEHIADRASRGGSSRVRKPAEQVADWENEGGSPASPSGDEIDGGGVGENETPRADEH